jgi:GNAT superfamily N-acetyltransferase
VEIKIITPQDDPFYKQMLALRNTVLREPIGLNLMDEDLSDEVNQLVFVGIVDNAVNVCLLFKMINEEILKLRQMATHPMYQKLGLGTLLVEAATEWALEKSYSMIELHAREEAVPFYKKMNYQIVGELFEEVGIPHYRMEKIIR